jgi:hypothetical protein
MSPLSFTAVLLCLASTLGLLNRTVLLLPGTLG